MACTDMSMLRALLSVKQKLSTSEAKAFRQMLEDLERGEVVSLSRKQRAWAEGKYLELQLDKARPAAAPIPPVKKAAPTTEFPWEKNRPLKPPGRS